LNPGIVKRTGAERAVLGEKEIWR